MKTLFVILWLGIASINVFAKDELSEPESFPKPSAIPVNWILQKVMATQNSVKVRDRVLVEQNTYSSNTLDRNEFLEFYRNTLSFYFDTDVDAFKFIELTYPFLRRLNLSYEEILDIAFSLAKTQQSAGGLRPSQEIADIRHRILLQIKSSLSNRKPLLEKLHPLANAFNLKSQQGFILERLLQEQAPTHIQSLLKVARYSYNPSELVAYLFPFFALPASTESQREYQLQSYLFATSFDFLPDHLLYFIRSSADYLYELNPSTEEIAVIAWAPAQTLNRMHAKALKMRMHPMPVLQILQFHLRECAERLGPERFNALSKIHYDAVQAVKQVMSEIRNDRDAGREYEGLFSDFEPLLEFDSEKNLLPSFLKLQPKIVNAATAQQIIEFSEQMTYLGISSSRVIDHLITSLKQASDAESFAKIFFHNPTDLLPVADVRFKEFVLMNPDIEMLLAVFTKLDANPERISEVHLPEQFVALLLHAIEKNRWLDPFEFEHFLEVEFPRFFAMVPTPEYKDLIAILTALRHRPVQNARKQLEQKAGEIATAVPAEDILKSDLRKRFFLNLALYELQGCAEGKRPFDVESLNDRNRLRDTLQDLLGSAIASYYPKMDGLEQRARLFADLLLHDELKQPAAALRLLSVLGDEVSLTSDPRLVALINSAIASAPSSLGIDAHKKRLMEGVRDQARNPAASSLLKGVKELLTAPTLPSPTAISQPKKTAISKVISSCSDWLVDFRLWWEGV